MSKKISQNLEGVSKTLLMTLLVRARESQRPDAMIHDEAAIRMVDNLEADFSHLRMQRHDEVAVIVRMGKFDQLARGFLARHPAGVVVHIGCGLDTRFERVDNGQVTWFDLDLPEVIELRGKLLPALSDRVHILSASVFDEGWIETVGRYRPGPFLFIAEGVLPYFEESQVKDLVLKLQYHFPGCELVCDAHSPFVVWADNLHLALFGQKVRMHWRLKDARDVEGWAPGIHLLEGWHYLVDEDSPLKAFRWMRLIPFMAKSSGIYHFHLGG